MGTGNHRLAGNSPLCMEYLYCTHQPLVNLFLSLTTEIMRHPEATCRQYLFQDILFPLYWKYRSPGIPEEIVETFGVLFLKDS